MVATHDLHVIATPESIIEEHRSTAGNHENMADAPSSKRFDDVIRDTNEHNGELDQAAITKGLDKARMG